MFAALKVSCFGFRGVGSQVDRVEEGFRAEGCQLVDDPFVDADLIYANDSGAYAKLTEAKQRGGLRGKLILNCLDLAPHIPSFPLAQIKEQLSHADAVTTISTFVQQDLAARAGVSATVIYNPIRPVSRNETLRWNARPNPIAMFVGRVNDPAKRTGIGAAALSILGFGWDDMVTVGREQPHYGGAYVGEVTDAELNGIYNRSHFVMFPSFSEGLGLPMCEAMACGAIPVICNDLCTREEFFPRSVFPEYDEVEPNAPSIARFMNRFMQDNDAKEEFKARLWNHYKANWEVRLSPRGVAQAILGVYQGL